MYKKETEELFAEIKEDTDIKKFLADNENEKALSMPKYLQKLLDEKKISKKEVIQNSGIERVYAYHIFSGEKAHPARKKLIALGLSMKLNLDEMQHLLLYGKHSPLYPRNTWDAVVIAAILKKLTVKETNILLTEMGETETLV